VATAGESAVVLGNRVLIAGRDPGRIGVADRTAAVFIELAAQLQFQRVHAAYELLMHLFDQAGIAWETARVQIAHLLDQGLQRLPRLWIILHGGTHLVQKVQSLVNLALGIGRVGTLPGRYGLTGDASIAGILAAIYIAVAPAAARTDHTVADQTRLASAHLTYLLAAGLTILTALTTLDLRGTQLAETPSWLRNLTSLTSLHLDDTT